MSRQNFDQANCNASLDLLVQISLAGQWQVVIDFILEFLHCTPVGSKPGSDMPNMAVPDLNKI